MSPRHFRRAVIRRRTLPQLRPDLEEPVERVCRRVPFFARLQPRPAVDGVPPQRLLRRAQLRRPFDDRRTADDFNYGNRPFYSCNKTLREAWYNRNDCILLLVLYARFSPFLWINSIIIICSQALRP